MSKQMSDRMPIFKKIFSVLLVLNFVELVSQGITFIRTFGLKEELGQMVQVVAIGIFAVIIVGVVFKILAEIFIVRSTSPTFSRPSGRKGYVGAARILGLLDVVVVLFYLLSAGGEGATFANQANLYLRILVVLVEMITAFSYVRTVKKLS